MSCRCSSAPAGEEERVALWTLLNAVESGRMHCKTDASSIEIYSRSSRAAWTLKARLDHKSDVYASSQLFSLTAFHLDWVASTNQNDQNEMNWGQTGQVEMGRDEMRWGDARFVTWTRRMWTLSLTTVFRCLSIIAYHSLWSVLEKHCIRYRPTLTRSRPTIDEKWIWTTFGWTCDLSFNKTVARLFA